MLQSLNFDQGDLIELFLILDLDNTGCLQLDDFLFGMSRVQGEPRAKDFLALTKLCETTEALTKCIVSERGCDEDQADTRVALKVKNDDVVNRIQRLSEELRTTRKELRKLIDCLESQCAFDQYRLGASLDSNSAQIRAVSGTLTGRSYSSVERGGAQ
eukprot:GEMP01083946.1.p1 GENE.GEMP01083946.1~~GEMP01083946.1.p1  ORF type:complete len:158 (+),score=17.23 GEMP01083946.1:359-832(+)